MSLLPLVSDAEIDAAAVVLADIPQLKEHLGREEARGIIRAALAAAAEARRPGLVRADGAVFQIGAAFSSGRALWRCTDIGARTVTAVRIDRVVTPRPLGESETWATEQSAADPRKLPAWLNGPPYEVAEFCFDEGDIEAVRPVAREKVPVWDPDP